MTTFTEVAHAAGFIISEANGQRSRQNVTLASGQVVKAGQVLGIITSGGKYSAYSNQNSDGTEVAKAISINAVDATAGDTTIAVIARDAEVNADELTYEAGSDSPTDDAAAVVDLASVHIIVR